MYLVSNLNTSTHAAKEDKEDDKDKGKDHVFLVDHETLIPSHCLMCLLSNLNTSTHAAKEDKKDDEDKGKGKGKCTFVPVIACSSFEAQCCKTEECETGEICCQTICKSECLKQKEIKEPIMIPEVNLSKEECKEYNKTASFVTTNPSVTRN
ncbi:hypothetical protein TNIN_482221 [Trichonephila inaurata madagascariensis]|uniref:WAP domain-containing protein n=1 Tax=Trichonephila inaurata madagascariensis TaxID=2747483 RepID=A0A8X7BR41_9ARAC|nr:hypothetical protein TNIN_482221 [Trichonephila inaurata madagascariensis]